MHGPVASIPLKHVLQSALHRRSVTVVHTIYIPFTLILVFTSCLPFHCHQNSVQQRSFNIKFQAN